ncbi:MAG: hypothetical protein K2I18_01485 [Paramuribaculum sp.]|nr:hypothetical protein [Paramuribaculum sp.]
MIRYIAIIFLMIIFVSCDSATQSNRDIVSEVVGKQIIIPDTLTIRIKNDTINYDFSDAGFKILVYVDSSDCTSCKMKLGKWVDIVNEFKNITGGDLNFLMIVNSHNDEEISYYLERDNFPLPVAIDADGRFRSLNKIRKENEYQTFLLDESDNILAIGNPTINPKIRSLYRGILSERTKGEPKEFISQPKGVIMQRDTVYATFRISNPDNVNYTVQELVPSCDCIKVQSLDTMPSHGFLNVNLKVVPDTLERSFYKYVDVFFTQKELPIRLSVHGFIKTNTL